MLRRTWRQSRWVHIPVCTISCQLSAVSGQPGMKDFRELKIWQKAHALTLEVYRVTAESPRSELSGLTRQLRRAASSIPCNIAERCDRGSDADFARFLQMALGSASELEYQLLLCHDLG